MNRTRSVVLLAATSCAALLAGLLHGGTATAGGGPGSVVDLPAATYVSDLATLDVVTRLSRTATGPVTTTVDLGVQVGSAVRTSPPVPAASWPGCPVWVWLLALDPATAAVRSSLLAAACDPAAVTAAVDAVYALPGAPSLVIVNTLEVPHAAGATAVDPQLPTALARLGLGPLPGADLATLDLTNNALTMVGRVGDHAGDAWARVSWTGYDQVGAAPTGFVPTFGAVRGRLVPNDQGGYHFLNLDTVVVRRTGGDGPGGWRVGSQDVPYQGWPGGGGAPPPGRGGFQLVTLSTRAAGPTGPQPLVEDASTYWTNTGVAAADAAAWQRLAADLLARDADGRVLLLRNVGDGKAAVTTSAADPSLALAVAMARIGGSYAAVVQLGAGDQLSVVIPGSSVRDVPPLVRPSLPTTFSTEASPGHDARWAVVLLRRDSNGYAFGVAGETTVGPTGTYLPGYDPASFDPYVVDEVVGQPSTPWPALGPAEQVAYAAWSKLYCGCDSTDVRRTFLSGYLGDPEVVFDTHLQPPPGIAPEVWTSVGQELLTESTWARNVWTFAAHLHTVEDYTTGVTGDLLMAAWRTAAATLKADTGLDVADDDSAIEGSAVAVAVLMASVAEPLADKAAKAVTANPVFRASFALKTGAQATRARHRIAEAYELGAGLAIAAWFGADEFLWPYEGPDRTIDVPVANLGNALVQKLVELREASDLRLQQVLSDYGRLRTMGQALGGAMPGTSWWVDVSDLGAQAAATSAALQAGMYRVLLQVMYTVQFRYMTALDGSQAATVRGNAATSEAALVVPSPGPLLAGTTATASPGLIWGAVLVSQQDGRAAPNTLLDHVRAAGVWLPDIFEQWPLLHEADPNATPALTW